MGFQKTSCKKRKIAGKRGKSVASRGGDKTERSESEVFGKMKKVHVPGTRVYIQYLEPDTGRWYAIILRRKKKGCLGARPFNLYPFLIRGINFHFLHEVYNHAKAPWVSDHANVTKIKTINRFRFVSFCKYLYSLKGDVGPCQATMGVGPCQGINCWCCCK